MSNKLIFGSSRKKVALRHSTEKGHVRGHDTGKEGGRFRDSLAK